MWEDWLATFDRNIPEYSNPGIVGEYAIGFAEHVLKAAPTSTESPTAQLLPRKQEWSDCKGHVWAEEGPRTDYYYCTKCGCPGRREPDGGIDWPDHTRVAVEPAPRPPVQNAKKLKANYIGAPAVFALELACADIIAAFNGYGCYVVGSSLERADWRDVDVRFIMADEDFAALFPTAGQYWEQNARWLLMTVAISERLSKVTGLPIDFQFQPRTHANERHKGVRHSIGLRISANQPEVTP